MNVHKVASKNNKNITEKIILNIFNRNYSRKCLILIFVKSLNPYEKAKETIYSEG